MRFIPVTHCQCLPINQLWPIQWWRLHLVMLHQKCSRHLYFMISVIININKNSMVIYETRKSFSFRSPNVNEYEILFVFLSLRNTYSWWIFFQYESKVVNDQHKLIINYLTDDHISISQFEKCFSQFNYDFVVKDFSHSTLSCRV